MAVNSHAYRHRARFVRSKRLALSDPAAMSAVLGLAPSASSSAGPTLPGTPDTAESTLQLEKLTTATKSLGDYFRDKLAARAGAGAATTPSGADTPGGDAAPPRAGLGSAWTRASIHGVPTHDNDADERPRGGLGLGMGLGMGLARGLGFAAGTLGAGIASPAPAADGDAPADDGDAPATAAVVAEVDAAPRRKKAKKDRAALEGTEGAAPGHDVAHADAPPTRKKSKRRADVPALDSASAPDDASAAAPAADGPVEAALGVASVDGDDGDTEAARKAAKRARKEQRRLARAAGQTG
jgi:hypothetical protein